MSTSRRPRTKVQWVNKPPVYRRAWTYIWLLVLTGLALMITFSAFHGYQFPCRIGNGGIYNCEASDAARWTAAVRDGIGAICFVPFLVIPLILTHAAWANLVRPELLKQKGSPASTNGDAPVQE